jgi:hypothetical protein
MQCIPTTAERPGSSWTSGFNRDDWHSLAAALIKARENHHVAKTKASPHGMKHIVDFRIETPGGKRPTVQII